MEAWPALVELYEYKVADVLSGREPRGGRRSVNELRDMLLTTSLDTTLLRRFITADRHWRHHTRYQHGGDGRRAAVLLGEIISVTAPERPDLEAEALTRLVYARWRGQLQEATQPVLASWAASPGALELRALASLQLSMQRGEAVCAGAGQADMAALFAELLEQLLAFRSDSLTALEQARRLALALHSDPQLLASVQDAQARPTHAEWRAALERVLTFLDSWFPVALGGQGPGPGEPPALLWGEPGRAPSQPDEVSLLALRLPGGEGLSWHGLDLTWQPVAGGWRLALDGLETPLTPQGGVSGARILLDALQLEVWQQGDYLLLALQESHQAPLFERLALARPVAALLDPAQAYINLRLSRGVMQLLREGRLEPGSLGPQSVERYQQAEPLALQVLARKAAETLVARLPKLSRPDMQRTFLQAAKLLRATPERAEGLLALLYTALYALPPAEQSEQLVSAGQYALLDLQGGVQALQVAGQPLRLHAAPQGWQATFGGLELPLEDLTVLPGPAGSALLARLGRRVAVAYQPAGPD